MKMTKKLLVLIAFVFASTTMAQTVHLVPQNGTETITLSAGEAIRVYDHGGSERNYVNGCEGTLVIRAAADQEITILGGTYDTEKNWDYLYIYDGVEVSSSTLLGKYADVGTVPLMSSTAEAITVKFTSDGSNTVTGFLLEVYSLGASDYGISYDLDGGTAPAPANPFVYTSGTAHFTLNEPTKAGYRFTGWTEANDPSLQTTVNITTKTTGHLYYTANWEATEYTISYDLVGGTGASANPLTYTVETSFTLNNPTKADHTFTGWTEANDATLQTTVDLDGNTGDKTYTANWTAVTFVSANDEQGTVSAVSSLEGLTVTATALSGYTFVNWTIGGSEVSTSNSLVAYSGGDNDVVTANFVTLFGGGTGDVGSPFELSTLAHLEAFSASVNAGANYTGMYLKLTADIDASATGIAGNPSNNDGAGFAPIGTIDSEKVIASLISGEDPSEGTFISFNGYLNGAGFAVKDLFINRPNEDVVGFIGLLGIPETESSTPASIESLGIIGDITGGSSVGRLVGYNFGTVNQCYATGLVTLSETSTSMLSKMMPSAVGGLVAMNEGTVSQCYAIGSVTSLRETDIDGLGGLVGYNVGTVSQSYASGLVNDGVATRNVGGLIVITGMLLNVSGISRLQGKMLLKEIIMTVRV